MTIKTSTELLEEHFQDAQPKNSINASRIRDFVESVPYLGPQGWSFHLDGQYTAVAPRTILAGVRTQMTIDGVAGDMGHPVTVHNGDNHFWNITTNKIVPSGLNDFGIIRVAMTGKSPIAVTNRFEIELDIGAGPYPVIFKQTAHLSKGANAEESYNFIIPLFAGPEFIANGGSIYITPQDDAEFWEFGITAVRVYAAPPVV